jgi:hypothetical protein
VSVRCARLRPRLAAHYVSRKLRSERLEVARRARSDWESGIGIRSTPGRILALSNPEALIPNSCSTQKLLEFDAFSEIGGETNRSEPCGVSEPCERRDAGDRRETARAGPSPAQVSQRSRTCASVTSSRSPRFPAVSRGVERFAEPYGSGRFPQSNFRTALLVEPEFTAPALQMETASRRRSGWPLRVSFNPRWVSLVRYVSRPSC